MNPDSIDGIAAFATLLFIALGAWTIHSRLRNKSSLMFLLSVIAVPVWILASVIFDYFFLGASAIQNSKELLNIVYVAKEVFIPALLVLFSSISFFLVTRTIAQRNPG